MTRSPKIISRVAYLYGKDLINKSILKDSIFKRSDKLHLGCGDVHLNGFINVDFRLTTATDIVHDCTDLSIFPIRSFNLVYSNAFFEHLYKTQQVKCLKEVNKILKKSGKVLFIGIPDFELIVKNYLDTHNLDEAYRMTHGDPERRPKWWMAQLHKSLFDKKELQKLLKESGFNYSKIFSYCLANQRLADTMGFLAFKDKPKNNVTKDEVIALVASCNQNIKWDTLQIK